MKTTKRILLFCALASVALAQNQVNRANGVNAQTGTTYTVLDGDRGKLVTISNASSVAVTLPQANGSTFTSGWCADFANRGAGTVTITPTTSTIDGAASLALTQNQGVRVCSDASNYFTQRGVGSAGGGGGTTTPSSSDTFTNKIFDCEATGNSCIIPFIYNFSVAVAQGTFGSLAFSLPTSNAPVPVVSTGTNTQKAYAQFTATGQNVQGHFTLPYDWTGNIDLRGKYASETATSGNVDWAIATVCVADAATGDPAFGTADTITDAVKGTILQYNDFSKTTIAVIGCSAGNEMFYKLTLGAGTTATGNQDLIALQFVVRRTI